MAIGPKGHFCHFITTGLKLPGFYVVILTEEGRLCSLPKRGAKNFTFLQFALCPKFHMCLPTILLKGHGIGGSMLETQRADSRYVGQFWPRESHNPKPVMALGTYRFAFTLPLQGCGVLFCLTMWIITMKGHVQDDGSGVHFLAKHLIVEKQ